MSVTIVGHNTGSEFAAIEIDTPYHYAGPIPAPAYYGPGWWYPGFAYGYGPAFSLAFVFGSGYVHRPFYPYYRGGPYYHAEYFRHPEVVPRAFVGRTFAGGGEQRVPLAASRAPGFTARESVTARAYAPRAYSTATSRGYAARGYTGATRSYTAARSSGYAGARGGGYAGARGGGYAAARGSASAGSRGPTGHHR